MLNAFVQGKRLHIKYCDDKLKRSDRTVSVQRLVYYRDNWYMDAWCHTTNGLKTFSLARIERSDTTDEATDVIAQERLAKEFMGSGYSTEEPASIWLAEKARSICSAHRELNNDKSIG